MKTSGGCVRSYLEGLTDLTEEDRRKLAQFLDWLRDSGDKIRQDQGRRIIAGSPTHFLYDPIFQDSTGRYRHFRFVIDDASAVYGVPRLVYVDDLSLPPPP